MAKKHLNKRSTSLDAREVQIKTTLRFILTLVKMATIKSKWQLMLTRIWYMWSTHYCWRECNLAQPLWKSVWWFLRKTGRDLLQDSTVPFLGIYPRDTSTYHKDISSTTFIAAIVIIARNWKQSRFPQQMNE